ncbi:hypothetical protein HYT04_01275 [Candidatus Kaiserbacteria bacterium]|nr:hypothetical protein [Candidatus Kaiserbacteria bacterium]
MKSITRYSAVFVASAMLIAPSLSYAQTQIYSDSFGNFQYNSPNFSIGFGSGAGNVFACGASNICRVASTILFIINNVLVPVLFAVAFIVLLYGIVLKYIFSHGDPEKVSEGHKVILWGLVAFVVMISIWGLVNVIANTFGLYGIGAPPTPRSY